MTKPKCQEYTTAEMIGGAAFYTGVAAIGGPVALGLTLAAGAIVSMFDTKKNGCKK